MSAGIVMQTRTERTQAVPKTPRKACCCGTEDGRCCGMGCCMRQSPNQVPPNPPLRTGGPKNEAQFIALANAIAGSTVIGAGERRGGTPPVLAGTLAAATLQSQHVRIQT